MQGKMTAVSQSLGLDRFHFSFFLFFFFKSTALVVTRRVYQLYFVQGTSIHYHVKVLIPHAWNHSGKYCKWIPLMCCANVMEGEWQLTRKSMLFKMRVFYTGFHLNSACPLHAWSEMSHGGKMENRSTAWYQKHTGDIKCLASVTLICQANTFREGCSAALICRTHLRKRFHFLLLSCHHLSSTWPLSWALPPKNTKVHRISYFFHMRTFTTGKTTHQHSYSKSQGGNIHLHTQPCTSVPCLFQWCLISTSLLDDTLWLLTKTLEKHYSIL